MNNQCIIFVSSKKECIYLYKILSKVFNCTYAYADLDNRKININDFRKNKYQFIIATTVLERGITIPKINVIILDFNKIFDMASIIQMLGRVGRDYYDNKGDAYILTNVYSNKLKDVNKYLSLANSYL